MLAWSSQRPRDDHSKCANVRDGLTEVKEASLHGSKQRANIPLDIVRFSSPAQILAGICLSFDRAFK